MGEAMKIERHGKAAILSQQEIQLLFSEGLQTSRDRALFGICLFTACRIREACTRGLSIIRTESNAKLSALGVPIEPSEN
jgi:integrase/recombinase XerD